nr:ArsA-related P-loop ATPase [Streptomyces sp. HNM0574]
MFVTGQGGAGRTTVAAATALAAARTGRRTLLLSTEPGRVLAGVLGEPGTAAARLPDAVEAAPGLWAARADPAEEFRARAVAGQEQARAVLDLLGAEPLDGDELTELPGAEAFALLDAVRRAHGQTDGDGPAWDTVVVDLPPTARALALLALPEQLRRYLRRLLPPERQAARALRPVLAQLAGVPVPAERLYATAARWERELADVQRIVDSPLTSVRFVAEPGQDADGALREARSGLALHGLRLDAVVANRLPPADSADPWLAAFSAARQETLHAWRARLEPAGVPVHALPHLGRAPQGPADLTTLVPDPAAHLRPEPEPPERPEPESVPGSVEDDRAGSGHLLWRLPLPDADGEELGLLRRGDELIVSCGPFRRVLPLPSALRRCRGAGAALEDGELTVRFAPDPGLWPGERTGGG